MSRKHGEVQGYEGTQVEVEEATNMESTEVMEVAETAVTEAVAPTVVKGEVAEMLLDTGAMGSRSAYIRQEFKKDRNRGDIAKELAVPYYIVYSATANMFNGAHPEGGGSTGSARGELVTITEVGRVYIADGAAYEGEEKLISVARPAFMRELVQNGMSRGDIAKLFDCPYATVYAATKEEGGTPGKVARITFVHPETMETVNRADYIRELFNAGKTRKEIAVHITKMTGELCDYSTVWAATKPVKEEAEAITTDAEALAVLAEGETVTE